MAASPAATGFEAQLDDTQMLETAQGLRAVLAAREELGGHRDYGKASEASCYPALQVHDQPRPRVLWPMTLDPVTGVVEVVFQHLKRRPPL